MSTPFKMSGFSGFGNSPVKQKKDLKPYKFGDDAGQNDVDLTRKGTISIEARNLFLSFNVEKIL